MKTEKMELVICDPLLRNKTTGQILSTMTGHVDEAIKRAIKDDNLIAYRSILKTLTATECNEVHMDDGTSVLTVKVVCLCGCPTVYVLPLIPGFLSFDVIAFSLTAAIIRAKVWDTLDANETSMKKWHEMLARPVAYQA
jgi:hypothetical protein